MLGALVLWPVFGSGMRTRVVHPVAAAVLPDYSYRNATIAFYEKRIRRDPVDQISARLLGQQYMQRYRETGDIGDIERSMLQARRSLELQPGNNWSSYEILGSAETALHHFKAAMRDEEYAHADRSDDTNAVAQIASLQMELGQYDRVASLLAPAVREHPGDPGLLAVDARYKELTGNVADARLSLDRATVVMDSVIDNSAQARAWFHFRAGEMAFATGATSEAEQDERDALAIFPNFAQADNALARFCWAAKDWHCALDSATKGADLVPLPETLGYKADAQRATGDTAGARQTDEVIYAIERIGNAYHVSDRLLAVYYSEHRIRTGDALTIARREIGVRGNEIYAQDTLAWAAAADGHWAEARTASRLAVRLDTQDARLHYHAGIIALHFGDRKEAKRQFERALALNAQFHPVYADDARRQLAAL